MNETIALITPTRDREEAMALCSSWMMRQTYSGPVWWIIVDDGDKPIDIELVMGRLGARKLSNWQVTHCRRQPSNEPVTLQDNLLAGLDLLKEKPVEALLIVEDDEHYSPLYVEEMVCRLKQYDIVGEMKARYFNVHERRWEIVTTNVKHASLCRTGFRGSVIPSFRKVVEHAQMMKDPFIDIPFWGATALIKPPPPPPLPPEMMNRPWAAGAEWKYQERGTGAPQTSREIAPPAPMPDFVPQDLKAFLFEARGISIGIKGLPGRGGIGKSHAPMAFKNPDPRWEKLIEWIGPDAQHYMDLAKKLGWDSPQ